MKLSLLTTPTAWVRGIYNLPYVLLVLATLFWSINIVLGRAVRLDVPPIGLAFWRWTWATLLISGFAWPHVRRDWPVIREHWRIVLLLAFLGITVFNTLLYIGVQFTTALNAALVQSIMPVLIVVITFLFFKERVTAIQAIGILLSMGGALTILTQGNLDLLLALSFNGGDLIILVAVICYAGYSAFLRKRPAIHPLSLIAVTFLWGVLILLPFYLWEHTSGRTMQLNLITLASVGYVAIFPSIVAYFCFNRGVELVGANRAGPFIHLLPTFASLWAIFLLGEVFRWYHGAGIVLIFCGILLATRR